MTAEEYDRWYCTAYPSSVAHQVGEALPDADARVVRAVTEPTAQLLGRLRGVLLAVVAVSLAGAALGVAAVMTAAVLERRLEAGLLVALGAEGWWVAAFFLVEAALLGLAGGLAGGAAGLLGGRLLGHAVLDVTVPWAAVLLPVAAAAGVAVALAGGSAPVARLFRESPAEALRRATA
jgi:putative ABC transport system permease protein